MLAAPQPMQAKRCRPSLRLPWSEPLSSVSDLPGCLLPLRSEEAQQEYDLLGRALVQAGRLTIGMHRGLSSYAAQFDGIIRAAREGKQVRASWFTQLDRARAELKLDELEKA